MKSPHSADTAVPRLLAWFAAAARPMPWRGTTDPYGVWVSEIMLQQTQVKTVIPYWERWMRRFPDIEALAAAPETDVLKHWEGLGYYSRARRLQEAARAVVAQGTGLPATYEGWLALPGVGPYTAGAVASIAFDAAVPAVDGNVIRVLTRWMALGGNPAGKEVAQAVRDCAVGWVTAADRLRTTAGPARRPCSALNQALMELGATVCTPRQPACPACPLSSSCAALAAGRAEAYPESPPRPRAERLEFAAVVLQRRDHWWVRRRPVGEVNGGLWEFPSLPISKGETPAEVATAWAGVDASELVPGPVIRHSITRYRITVHPFHAALSGGGAPPGPGRWAPRSDLEALPFAAAHRRLARRVLQGAAPGKRAD